MLRIRNLYLEAIEDGRFQDLPGATYAIGFIRAYADHLGLDSDEVVRRYKDETSDINGKTDLVFPVPIPESGVPGGAILLVGVVIAVLAYGGWYVSSSDEESITEVISPLPDRFQDVLPKEKASSPDGQNSGVSTSESGGEYPQEQSPEEKVTAFSAAPPDEAAEENNVLPSEPALDEGHGQEVSESPDVGAPGSDGEMPADSEISETNNSRNIET
ncbi:MAG: helix-turn-helix domain-containing protein, partial [Rhodospirillales bacterium]